MKNRINDLFLFINTSQPEAVISLHKISVDQVKKISETKWLAYRELSATLTLKVKDILDNSNHQPKDLKGILVYPGPGSFTGLRIGISFANALAYGLGIPLYQAKKNASFETKNKQKVIIPVYGSEPKITKPKQK